MSAGKKFPGEEFGSEQSSEERGSAVGKIARIGRPEDGDVT